MLQKEKANNTNIHNFVKISINQVIELDNDDDKWLKITIRDRLVLEEKRSIEKVEHDEKSVDANQAQSVDSLVDSFSKLKSIDSIKSAKKFISFKTFASFQRSSSRTTVISSSFKSTTISFTSFKSTIVEEYSPLSKSSSLKSRESVIEEVNSSNLIDRIFRAREQFKNKRNVTSASLDESNMIERKRIRFASRRYSSSDYA